MQNKQTILQNWTNEQISINDIINNIFNLLNINEIEIKNKVLEISKNFTVEDMADKWFYAINIVSTCSIKQKKVFSQSQLYDLLTILSRLLDEKKRDLANTITFNVYKDIMENNKLNDSQKIIFPFIIINLMHILKYGHDLKGKPINLYAINNYYQNFKMNAENELEKIPSLTIEINNNHDNKIFVILKELTERNETDLHSAFQNLIESDQKKIEDICNNYQKLQEYFKIIETDGFSEKIEKEAGRKLSGSQLQHAIYSIKKTKLYLESLLDGVFVPKGKHGINHIKHNIEYGFQLAGIIQSKRKKSSF
jgi:hypothetical protein